MHPAASERRGRPGRRVRSETSSARSYWSSVLSSSATCCFRSATVRALPLVGCTSSRSNALSTVVGLSHAISAMVSVLLVMMSSFQTTRSRSPTTATFGLDWRYSFHAAAPCLSNATCSSFAIEASRFRYGVARPIKRGRELAVDEFFDEVPRAPAAQFRSDQTSCRKAVHRPNRPQPSCYRLSWRGLQSGALTPESGGLKHPETTPP